MVYMRKSGKIGAPLLAVVAAALLLLSSCSSPVEVCLDAEYSDSSLTLAANVPMDEEMLAGLIALEPSVPVTVSGDGAVFTISPREPWPEDARITLTVQPFTAPGAVLASPYIFTFQTPPLPGFELAAVGDVMLDYLTSERLRDYDPAYPFAAIAPLLKEGDLVFANLECPMSDRGAPVQKTYTFRAPLLAIDALMHAGINVVSLANNHILDYGALALEDTFALLEEHGIAYCGAGREEGLARKGAIFEMEGIKTAVLAYSGLFNYGYPAWRAGPEKSGALFYHEREQFIKDIEEARRWADVLIVSLHFGEEYTHRVSAEQRETGRLAIDSGADLVLGHHSHTPQGVEIYGGKPIVYSMGNFLFYPFDKSMCNESYILRARIGKKGVEHLHLLPVLLGNSRPSLAVGEEGIRLRALLTGLLDELGTAWEIEGDAITIPLDP